jgi:D-3-phosphoglycerate dehydrogenase
VIRLVHAFGARILANDVTPREVDAPIEWTSKDRIFREADVLTLHVPLTPLTRHVVGAAELKMMKSTAFLVNTARGGVVDETALATALRTQEIAGAGVDVFCNEPYTGELAGLDTCLITCHMGSMSEDCRFRMECEAAENAVRFVRGQPIAQLVPESEYLLRSGTPAS